jgi:hypothetical protein
MAPSPATDQWARVGGTLLKIRAASFVEDIAFIVEKGLAGVRCNANEVSLLADYRFPELCVHDNIFVPKSDLDLSNIASMTQLTGLTLDCEGLHADLRRLDRLEELEVIVGKRVQLPAQTPSLRKLTLRKFSPQPSDLGLLPDAPLLDYLWIVAGSLASVEGIARFRSLELIRLALLPKLMRVAPLTSLLSLRRLDIEACPNVIDIDQLRDLRSLEVLYIHNKSIPSIAFLTDLPALQEVNLGETNVLDGDLSPLLRIPSVHFVNRKHYSHTRTREEVLNEYGHMQYRYGPMLTQRR